MGVDLKTRYMGLSLSCPIVVSASPLSRDVDTVRRIETAGAGAVVLFSLFEEQFAPVRHGAPGVQDLPVLEECQFRMSPPEYLEHIRRLKEAVGLPIVASLNACRLGSWVEYAQAVEDAGADAIEVNTYRIVVDPTTPASVIEDECVEILRCVRRSVSIPVAVKLTPFYTNLGLLAGRLDAAGADALVFFNRVYQPTVDIERRQLVLSLDLSTPSESRLPLLWIARMKGELRASLAASSGIHGVKDVVRCLMAGADVAMVCSALLRHGVDRMADLHRLLAEWLDAHGHASVDEVRGVMSLKARQKPDDFGRESYAKILSRYA